MAVARQQSRLADKQTLEDQVRHVAGLSMAPVLPGSLLQAPAAQERAVSRPTRSDTPPRRCTWSRRRRACSSRRTRPGKSCACPWSRRCPRPSAWQSDQQPAGCTAGREVYHAVHRQPGPRRPWPACATLCCVLCSCGERPGKVCCTDAWWLASVQSVTSVLGHAGKL